MHVDQFVRGKGRFIITQYVPTDEKVNSRYPLLLTTGRILSQYNVGAQTRRTPNNQWHDEDGWRSTPRRRGARHRRRRLGGRGQPRRADRAARQVSERMQPGVVYTTFHFPESGANVITTDSSDWATNCPEYKVTAVQVTQVLQPSEWQRQYADFNRQQMELPGPGPGTRRGDRQMSTMKHPAGQRRPAGQVAGRQSQQGQGAHGH
jgi:formate dehydrogenase major subunit